MADLLIIAAGNGSRMGGSLPKALVPITDEPNLTTTLKQIGNKFNRVFVVTNITIKKVWEEYFSNLKQTYPSLAENVINIPITSGRGDGHAVMSAISSINSLNTAPIATEIAVVWGDVFFPNEEIIDELFEHPLYGKSGIVPVVMEQNPYVTIKTDFNNVITHADFSKLGETNAVGYHDQSIFRFNTHRLMSALTTVHLVLNKGGKYITMNGEMSLLYSFNYLYATGNGMHAQETKFPTMSFNTIEEVKAIQQEINETWNRNQS